MTAAFIFVLAQAAEKSAGPPAWSYIVPVLVAVIGGAAWWRAKSQNRKDNADASNAEIEQIEKKWRALVAAQEERLTHLNERVARLEGISDELGKRLAEAQIQIMEGNRKTLALESDLARAHAKLELAQDRVNDLEARLAEARAETAELRQQLQHSMRDRADLRAQLTTLREQLELEREQVSNLSTQLSEAHRQRDNLRTHVEELELRVGAVEYTELAANDQARQARMGVEELKHMLRLREEEEAAKNGQ